MLPLSTNLDPTCFDRDGEDIWLLSLSELNAPKAFSSSTLLNYGTLGNTSTYNGVAGLNFFYHTNKISDVSISSYTLQIAWKFALIILILHPKKIFIPIDPKDLIYFILHICKRKCLLDICKFCSIVLENPSSIYTTRIQIFNL